MKPSVSSLMNQINKWREGVLRELAAKEMAEELFKD
ncbi:hypothetical protein vBRpoPV14_88 [Ruegeria phage vB_RpoP-V14]|nr:hypothetical protein vBRpoPV14_88 [Ruegeria phage vB_RpoP-V14]